MFELITSNAPLIIAFVLGTLVPQIYESIAHLFFHAPDHFLDYVNMTIVPRFGPTGQQVVLVLSQTAVMIIKQVGKALLVLGRHAFPIVLYIYRQAYTIVIEIGVYVYPILAYTIPLIRKVWDEITLFFSWTTHALQTEFVKFSFHVFALYLSVHLLIWGFKRVLKKVV